MMKIGHKFVVVTFKRMIIDTETFWEIVVEYSRSHISHVMQLDEDYLTYILSDHSLKNNVQQSWKQNSRYLISSYSNVPRSSRFNPDNISISLDSKY